MKLERAKNASRNIIFGILLKSIQIFIPFMMRTVMIWLMGVEYLGLNSLFVSTLQVLNLAELGVGSAMVYSMYKPISEDDNEKICALLNLYRKYYFLIGLVIAIVGVAITPVIPKLIKGEVPGELNVYILYLLQLFATVLSYWVFACRGCLLSAYQREDVISKIMSIINLVQYGIQLIVLYAFRDYYLYCIVALGTKAVSNCAIAVVTNRMYPHLKPRGFLERKEIAEINQKVRDLFTGKIGGVIVNSVDTIVISAFLGLTVLAVYQNYFYILTAVIAFVDVVFSACMAGIGNSLIVEAKEKNYNDLKKFTLILCWLSGFLTCCFLCLYQPFMELWVGKDLMLEFSAVICFCVYFYVYEINRLLNTYKDAGGIWHKDRWRPLITAATNFTLNLLLVQVWGIYGVLLSTVFSMIGVGMPWILHNIFTTLFEKKMMKEYIRTIFYYSFQTVIIVTLTAILCIPIKGNMGWVLIIRAIICCIVPNVYFLCIYRKRTEFEGCLALVNKMTRNKFSNILSRIK